MIGIHYMVTMFNGGTEIWLKIPRYIKNELWFEGPWYSYLLVQLKRIIRNEGNIRKSLSFRITKEKV